MFAITYSDNYLDQKKVISFQDNFLNSSSVELNTSGSTGNPKKLSLSTENIRASAHMTNIFFNFNSNTKALLCMSIDTIAGKMMLARAIEGNYAIDIQTPSSRPLEHFETKIDFIAMVPVQLNESLKFDFEKLKTIPTILVGGGPISEEIENRLKELNITVYHSFGMTETVSHIAMRKVGKETTPYYEALSGVTFKVNDGMLALSAEHLGIQNLATNDLIQLDSPTRFRWLGRADFVVNSGGYKIQLEEIEKLLTSILPDSFFCWKEPSDKWGEILVLCVLDSDFSSNDFSSLDLPAWKIPKKTYVFSKFIHSESGKILRKPTFAQIPLTIHE
ncbi:MAG: AMP-binding protein [Flavobacteriales bacterium]|jgi:o-succinylbenzoate---CoA ligase